MTDHPEIPEKLPSFWFDDVPIGTYEAVIIYENTWASSNTAIATVSNTGLVTAVGIGTTKITATTVDSAKTATYNVTVATNR